MIIIKMGKLFTGSSSGLPAAKELAGEDNFKFVQHDITQPILFDEHVDFHSDKIPTIKVCGNFFKIFDSENFPQHKGYHEHNKF